MLGSQRSFAGKAQGNERLAIDLAPSGFKPRPPGHDTADLRSLHIWPNSMIFFLISSLNERDRGAILERYIARYIDHISAGGQQEPAGGGGTGGHDMASEILSVGPIQQEDLDPHDELTLASVVKQELTVNDDTGHGVPVTGPDPHHHHHIMVECELEEADGEILLVK